MTPVSQIPLKKTSAGRTSVPVPRQSTDATTTAPTTAPRRRRVLRYGAAGLATIGLGTALGLGAMNAIDGGARSDDMTALQSDVATLQNQVSGLRVELIRRDAGYSLDREHLAQAPTPADYGYSLDREHLAQAPTPADYGYSVEREHLAQAPTVP